MTRRRVHVPPIPDTVLEAAVDGLTDPDERARAAITARQAWDEAHRHPVKAAANRDTMRLRLEDLEGAVGVPGSTYPPASPAGVSYRRADARGRVVGYDAGLRSSSSCHRCGRSLKDPVSQRRGVGPDCWADGYRIPDEELELEEVDADG